MSKPIPPLYNHQKRDIPFVMTHDEVYDVSDPGCGKTRVHIEAYANLRRAGKRKKALVVAPKSLLRSAWEEDIKKFAPDMVTSVATSSNRAKAFATEADIYITNVDAAPWLLANQKLFTGFDTLIIDEISNFKHRTSARSKAMAKFSARFTYRAGLDGTPGANSLVHMWHPAYIIDRGKSLGPSFFAFRSLIATPRQVGPSPNMVQWVDKDTAPETVALLLQNVTIRNKLEECVDIPPNLVYTVPFIMSPAQRKVYDEMERDALLLMDDGNHVTAPNAATVANKLLQIASGAVYSQNSDEGEVTQISNIASERAALVMDLIEQSDHCVVFFQWRHQRDQLIEEAQKRKISFMIIDGSVSSADRERSVQMYQAGRYRIALIHPASGAHGLTLTRGTTTIWASPTPNLEHALQGRARIYRSGQTKSTRTIYIVAKDTREERCVERLQTRNITQAAVMQGLLLR